METLVNIPILVAGVAVPLLAATARDDRARLRYAIAGLSEGRSSPAYWWRSSPCAQPGP
jgi:hypothetical protein